MSANISTNPEAMRYLELCRVINKSGRAAGLFWLFADNVMWRAGSGDSGRCHFAQITPNQAVVPFPLWQESCKRHASNAVFVGKLGKQNVERKE
jgi:hypothetical protein